MIALWDGFVCGGWGQAFPHVAIALRAIRAAPFSWNEPAAAHKVGLFIQLYQGIGLASMAPRSTTARSSTDALRRKYDRILLKNAANNPPYLSARGRTAILLIVASGAACATLFGLSHETLALFFAAFSASAVFCLALAYGYLLLVWRGLETHAVQWSHTISALETAVDDSIVLETSLDNGLLIPFVIHAIRWDHSGHLSCTAQGDEDRMIPGQCGQTQTYAFKAVGAGRGVIYGMGFILSDPADLFWAESHVEVSFVVSVRPHDPGVKQNGSAWGQNRESAAMFSRARLEEAGEIDRIRPYLQGDKMRRILWRGYARRRELTVWIPREEERRCAVFLVEGGAHMRLAPQNKPFSPPLWEAVSRCAIMARDFDCVSVISYDEEGATLVARALPAPRAMENLRHWAEGALQWRAPTGRTPDEIAQWSTAARALWQAFKLYKKIDFSQTKRRESFLDMSGLVTWARNDKIERALASEDKARVRALLSMPQQALLVALIREWYTVPTTTLSPFAKSPCFDKAVSLAIQIMREQVPTSFVWFSDFSSLVPTTLLDDLIGALGSLKSQALGVCMPMPTQSLNFMSRQGDFFRRRNRLYLSAVMKWME